MIASTRSLYPLLDPLGSPAQVQLPSRISTALICLVPPHVHGTCSFLFYRVQVPPVPITVGPNSQTDTHLPSSGHRLGINPRGYPTWWSSSRGEAGPDSGELRGIASRSSDTQCMNCCRRLSATRRRPDHILRDAAWAATRRVGGCAGTRRGNEASGRTAGQTPPRPQRR
jgi:hypothetical protein